MQSVMFHSGYWVKNSPVITEAQIYKREYCWQSFIIPWMNQWSKAQQYNHLVWDLTRRRGVTSTIQLF